MKQISIPKIDGKALHSAETAAWQASVFICGFLLARTELPGGGAPFGLGFAAGAPYDLSVAASIGAAIGYLFPVTSGSGFGYIAAAVLIAAVRFILPRKFKFTRYPSFASLLGLVAAFVPTVPALSVGVTVELLLSRLVGCAVSAGTAYFSCTAMKLRSAKNGLRYLPLKEAVCVTCVAGMLLMSFSGISVYGITASGVIATIIVLSASSGGRGAAGAAVGASLGFFLCAGGIWEPWCSAALAVGGLLAGVFAASGTIGSAISFITVCSVYVLLTGAKSPTLIYEALAGSMIFTVLPRKSKSVLAQVFAPLPEMPRLDGLRKAVSMRLSFASEALCDVSDTVEAVAHQLDKVENPPLNETITHVEDKVCRGCAMRCYCWEEKRNRTVLNLMNFAHGEADLTSETMSGCGRTPALQAAVKEIFNDHENKKAASARLADVRGVLTDQFSGIADMLAEVADEFDRERQFDQAAAESVEAALRAIDIIPSDIGCAIDRFGRMTVEIRVGAGDRAYYNKMTLLNEVSTACNRDFDPPTVCKTARGTLITLAEQARLNVDIGIASVPFNGNKMCGDSAEIFQDGRGHSIMLLSDGMGTGGRAAVDSAMVCGLMQRLIKAGFGYDSALRIVNSAMLLKSTEESMATLDVCSIDLFTGRTELYKAGACPTIVLRNGRTGVAECASLPAGILRDVTFDTASLRLSKGDIAVIFSDGVSSEGTDWICSEIRAWSGTGNAQQLAEHLAAAAGRRRSDGHGDDITVAVTMLV